MAPESPYIEHVQRANAGLLEYLRHVPTAAHAGDQERADRAAEVTEREAAAARRLREGE